MYICKCISSIIIIVIKSDLLIQNDMLFFIFKNDNPDGNCGTYGSS